MEQLIRLNLNLLPIDTLALIDKVCHIDKEKQRRLMEMGFCNNAMVKVICRHKNIICCQIRNYNIGLRSEDAQYIYVKQ